MKNAVIGTLAILLATALMGLWLKPVPASAGSKIALADGQCFTLESNATLAEPAEAIRVIPRLTDGQTVLPSGTFCAASSGVIEFTGDIKGVVGIDYTYIRISVLGILVGLAVTLACSQPSVYRELFELTVIRITIPILAIAANVVQVFCPTLYPRLFKPQRLKRFTRLS